MSSFKIPKKVSKEAQIGLDLIAAGFAGGTKTGIARARQLAAGGHVSEQDLKTMRAWFARHGPGASNGGTSFPGYIKWVNDDEPRVPNQENKNNYRGAVAWLIWGGTPAFVWCHSVI
jgi:hypothetical protein